MTESYRLEDMECRLLALEKQNRRLKRTGIVIVIAVAALALMGQTSQRKVIEANEFIVKDYTGNVRASLSVPPATGDAVKIPSAARLVFFDGKGKKRVSLDGSSDPFGIAGLTLFDGKERERARFVEGVAFDMGSLLMMQDEKGTLETRLKEGEVLANHINTTTVSVLDAEGFEASLGVTDLVTPRTGEKHKTSAASLVLFDKDKNVIWKTP